MSCLCSIRCTHSYSNCSSNSDPPMAVTPIENNNTKRHSNKTSTPAGYGPLPILRGVYIQPHFSITLEDSTASSVFNSSGCALPSIVKPVLPLGFSYPSLKMHFTYAGSRALRKVCYDIGPPSTHLRNVIDRVLFTIAGTAPSQFVQVFCECVDFRVLRLHHASQAPGLNRLHLHYLGTQVP